MLLKLLLFLLSLIAAIFILINPTLHGLILSLGSLDYLGGFVAGFFFVISLTVIPAVAVLFVLADILNPFLLVIIAGLGAMLGDYFLYRFFRTETDGIAQIDTFKNSPFWKKLRKLKRIRWLAIVVGMTIIASPLPDELGILLLGATKLETKKFLLLSFLLNTAGIFLVVGLGKII